jgi:hypothetical protein
LGTSARAHVYRADVAKEDTERRFVRELSQRLFAGSGAQLALRAWRWSLPAKKRWQRFVSCWRGKDEGLSDEYL